jgi:hypothetical protein
VAKCPNCKGDIAWDVPACPHCAALFSLGSAWRPIPDNDEEAANLANKYAAQPQAVDQPPSIGGALWIAFKFCFSLVLVLLTWLLSTTAFRGPEVDWRGLGFLGVLLFLAALPWVDFTRPSRALALVVVVFALGAGNVARGYLRGASQLPHDCSRRRWLLCELENQLFLFGGAPAVAALWFLAAALLLYCAYLLFTRTRNAPE